MRNLDETQSVFIFESKQRTEKVRCPSCGGRVNICELTEKHLRDMPIWSGVMQELCFLCHRYRCRACGKKHTEEIPFRHPGTRITQRAANWVRTMLIHKM